MNKLGVIALLAMVATAIAVPTTSRTSKINFKMDEDWYTIPTVDGRMELKSRDEIVKYLEKQPFFDAEADVRYLLHNRQNPAGVHVLINDREGLLAAGFNPALPVRFTAHGWGGSPTGGANPVQQYLQLGGFNHFVIDWSAGADSLNYITARNRVPSVAELTARYIRFLIANGSAFSRIYTIGHSLGGQLAAITGQYIDKSEGEIAACIGLDPAGPLFSNTDEDDRASPDDCHYVEIIHTNGWLLGFGHSIGDADFYPNGGRSQPGCGLDVSGNCAHGRVRPLFRESLVGDIPFIARECHEDANAISSGTCTPTGATTWMMGDPVNYEARGRFHLTTAESSPFALPLFAN